MQNVVVFRGRRVMLAMLQIEVEELMTLVRTGAVYSCQIL